VEKEAKEALIFDLVRKGKISKAKAAELLGLNLWDLPKVLAEYRIPWFDYGSEELKKDLETLKESGKAKEAG
jgi:predicted HTH domain antitoxin